MKKFFLFIVILICITLGLGAINNETDFFQNIGTYIPALEEKYPEITERIEQISNDISAISHQIPSFNEIKSIITGEELPIDPSDVAHNAYIKDSPMLSFNPTENISIQITNENTLEVFGIAQSIDKSNLIVCLNSSDGETIKQISMSVNSDNQFYEEITIPRGYDSFNICVYTSNRAYGNFISWVYDYVTILKNESGIWEISPSPVYDHNIKMYEKDKSISDALKSTISIQSEYENMKSVAQQITDGIFTDYERALAIHDWVCSYVYYDRDALLSDETAPYSATEVINRRRAVCLGYATLFATLCRAIDIPCNVVSGYALGIADGPSKWNDTNISSTEQNHAWNEVYLDGRWVIVDTTWDSMNKYENGEFVEGESVSHLYFDANLDFFSANHKILEYSLRR